jgi:hypothetical protein
MRGAKEEGGAAPSCYHRSTGIKRPGEAKVGNLEDTGVVDEQVGGFHITVHDVILAECQR